MAGEISIEGTVDLVSGKLVLSIPLAAGGAQLAPLARDMGAIDGDFLRVIIPHWLAEKLRIAAGSLVVVDNRHGKFTITRSEKNDQAPAISIHGPVERVDGRLVLRIPLSVGGAGLLPLARGMGEIEGEFLKVFIPPGLAEELWIEAGSMVNVDNIGGKLTITRKDKNDGTPQ